MWKTAWLSYTNAINVVWRVGQIPSIQWKYKQKNHCPPKMWDSQVLSNQPLNNHSHTLNLNRKKEFKIVDLRMDARCIVIANEWFLRTGHESK